MENHGVIHNMWFNTTTGLKKSYYETLHVAEWWDNGTLPIWITAQRQVRAHFRLIAGPTRRKKACESRLNNVRWVTMVTVVWVLAL